MHENCIAFKLDRPIALGSGLKITNLIFWEKKNSSRYHAELVHSQVGNSISILKLNRFYLSIMNEMSGLETDNKITDAHNLVNFYAWLERLARSVSEKLTNTKILIIFWETTEEMLGVISERASQLSKRSLKVQATNSKLKLLKASFRHCKKYFLVIHSLTARSETMKNKVFLSSRDR